MAAVAIHRVLHPAVVEADPFMQTPEQEPGFQTEVGLSRCRPVERMRWLSVPSSLQVCLDAFIYDSQVPPVGFVSRTL